MGLLYTTINNTPTMLNGSLHSIHSGACSSGTHSSRVGALSGSADLAVFSGSGAVSLAADGELDTSLGSVDKLPGAVVVRDNLDPDACVKRVANSQHN